MELTMGPGHAFLLDGAVRVLPEFSGALQLLYFLF
jgi:hypothetical protein